MRSFYNESRLIWLPLMKKPSKESYRHDPDAAILRVEYGPHARFLTAKLAAELANVSIKTVYKWIAGTHPMNTRTRFVLYSRALGLLPHQSWLHWHIDENGRLSAPNGFSFYPDELTGLSYIKQLNGELSADVARLSVENRMLREALDHAHAHRLPGNVIPFRPDTKKPGKHRAFSTLKP